MPNGRSRPAKRGTAPNPNVADHDPTIVVRLADRSVDLDPRVVDDVLADAAESYWQRRPTVGGGVDQATANRDSWWWSCASAAVETLARTGRPFTVEMLGELGVPQPDAPCRPGALISAAYRSGVIEPAGAVIGHDGRPRRAWVGVPAIDTEGTP